MRTLELPRDTAWTKSAGIRRPPCIWAVGGGKGGVGKSVVTSSLALALASDGPRCVVVDADLGGANLHTLLGVARPTAALGDFLVGRVADLADVMTPTPVPNLWLISGARAPHDMANPKHAQKQKLIRHLRRLDVAHVFVDLGAGSSFNVLDPFVAADRRIVVVAPEPTSIENAYHFLKAAFFRSLREVAQDASVREVLAEVVASSRGDALSPRDLVDAVTRFAPNAGRTLRREVRRFSPFLLVNQTRSAEQRRVGFEMSAAARRYLGVRLRCAGALDVDESVTLAVERRQPVLQLFPSCLFAEGLQGALLRMLRDEELPPETAPEVWRVHGRPAVATHGLGIAEELPPPRLPRRAAPPPPVPLPPIDLEAPGRTLRRCREALGLSLAELEERTRIRCLGAFELEAFDRLPPEPYLRCHALEYGRALGIASASALAGALVERARAAAVQASSMAPPRDRRRRRIDVLPRRLQS